MVAAGIVLLLLIGYFVYDYWSIVRARDRSRDGN
jgi:hypothetical protein